MKTFSRILILLLLLTACKQKTPKREQPGEPILWVDYKGENNRKDMTVILVSGDEEYRSEEALPQLAEILSHYHGFDCTVLFAQDPDKPGIINPNYRFNIPGLHLLQKADLVIWFTRFRELPEEQMQHLESYLKKGKPLVAIRTATHAFNFEDKDHPFAHYGWNYQGEKKDWHLGFGKRILGETWFTHHGNHKHQSTRGIIAEEASSNPILNGITNKAIWGATDVYGIRTPFEEDVEILVLGQTVDRSGVYDEEDLFYGMREMDTTIAEISGGKGNEYNPNNKMPPIVWMNSYQLSDGKKGKSLTSTIGAATDMLDEEVRRLFINSVYYLSDMVVPKNAKVDTIGRYRPSQFGFHDDEHWKNLNLRVMDFKSN